MKSEEIAKTLREIRSDNRSSATQLARRVVRLYCTTLTESHPSSSTELKGLILGISNQLRDVQPSMTPIHNIALMLNKAATNLNKNSQVLESNHSILRLLSKIENHLNTSKKRIAEEATSILPKDAVVITLSYSETVVEALLHAHRQKRLRQVILSESRPLLEGYKLAKLLRKHHIPVTLTVDAALPSLCRDADMALVGADTVFPNGSIAHKIGTYPLALACRDHKRAFYAAADSLKFQIATQQKNVFSIGEHLDSEVIGRRKLSEVKVRNIYFDITPQHLITGLITEFGIVNPTETAEIYRRLETSDLRCQCLG